METATDNRSQKAIEKENATKDSALVEKAKGIAAKLIEKFKALGVLPMMQKRQTEEDAKACARIVCDEIMSTEYRWSHKYTLYEEVKKQLE